MMKSGVIVRQTLTTLEANGYSASQRPLEAPYLAASAIAEDALGIVGIAVYDTFEILHECWRDAQSAVSALLHRKLGEADPKLKEAYLLLFCLTPYYGDARKPREIAEDTMIARKFVVLGQQLETSSTLDAMLEPLLPLPDELSGVATGRALEELSSLLERHDVSKAVSSRLVKAFLGGEPLMDAIAPAEV